jgi:hypothetical protein
MMAADFFLKIAGGKSAVVRLRGQALPRILLIVNDGTAELAVVGEYQGGRWEAKHQVIVLLHFVAIRAGEELARHAEMNLEVQVRGTGKEHALSMAL